jgi:DNA repair exonuclease SbcCD ATPase subunit
MNEYTTAVQKSVEQQKEESAAQEKINAAFDNLKNRVTQILSIGNAWNQVKQQIQATTQDLAELDASFASIAMVTDYDVSDMWSSYGDYAAMANELGQSTKDVIASSALFYQQGKPRL